MYTQCPECGVAFRVTAEVLRQAAGKVRCGGCGVAFNALNHLSEQKPQAPVRQESQPHLPELKPEEPPELEADEPPQTISAEQSAALLKTLDQLAGSDIRIEDTGIEWRVLDDDESADDAFGDEAPAEAPPGDSDLIADTGSLKFFIADDESDAQIDEVLEASPTPVDQFLTETPSEVDSPEIFEEMRFDDNTPLPDDFDLEMPSPAPEPMIETPESVEVLEAAQVNLELGDPDEWEDLLDEVAEPVGGQAAASEAEGDDELEAFAASNEPPAGDQPPDVDTQFAIQAEAMGIDLSGLHESVSKHDIAEADEAAPVAASQPETSIDEDLIAAAFESEAAARHQTELALEDTGIGDGPAIDDVGPDDGSPDLEVDEEPETAKVEDTQAEPEDDAGEEFVIELEDIDDDEAELISELKDTPVDERSLEIRLDDDDVDASDEHYVPEMTEEEKTINMLIDQELLSVAVEDEDGFASTIVQVQPNKKVEAEIEDKKEKAAAGPEAGTETEAAPAAERKVKKVPLVETIIMEGDLIRGEDDIEKSEKNRRLGEAMKAKRANDELNDKGSAGPSRISMIAAAVVLALLLLLQVIHQSREALATVPAFNDAVGPVYRMFGKPLTPAWDISGWRFEATKGSTDDADEQLTIYSRVGNKSDQALPYPLVHVSLTDRFEDIIGSRVLEPGEYLASDADPREMVAAGNTFNAVISIESPSADATGFKLNVCYRLASGQLRCATEDFK